MAGGDQIGIGVGLLVAALAPDRLQLLVGRNEILLEGVMKGVEEIEHVQQQQIGEPVERERAPRPGGECEQ